MKEKLEKNTAKYRIVRASCFVLLFVLCFLFFNALLMPKGVGNTPVSEAMDGFYDEPQNTIDVLYIGSSSVFRDISPIYIYHQYGIAGYSRATTLQGPMLTYAIVKETLEYQKPQVVVADFAWMFQNFNVDELEPDLHKALDPMPLSPIKMEVLLDIVSKSKTQQLTDYLFPFLYYHTRWSQLRPRDFLYFVSSRHFPFKGGGMVYTYWPYNLDEKRMVSSPTRTKYVQSSLYYYKKVVQLCKENGIKLVLLHLPNVDWRYQDYAAMKDFADQYGLDYIDYNLPELRQKTWDPAVDLYDHRHTNARGALKISEDFGAWLQQRFNLPDRRSDAAYSRWNEDYAAVEQTLGTPITQNPVNPEPDYVPGEGTDG